MHKPLIINDIFLSLTAMDEILKYRTQDKSVGHS